MSGQRQARRGTPRINFGTDVSWTAVSNVFDEATIDNVHVPLEVRLMAAARARIEPSGHAHWRRGELRGRLKVVSMSGKRAGELMLPVRSTLLRAIDRLVNARILLPGSSPECLVYVPFAVQTGLKHGSQTPCPRDR